MKFELTYHRPVMLTECIHWLDIQSDGIYVDLTFGGGGHSAAILKQLTSGHLYAFDQDPYAAANQIQDERFTFIPKNFSTLVESLKEHKVLYVNGILADLGVSSHQLDTAERGFSYRFPEALLDMRMNTQEGMSAADFLNEASEEEIYHALAYYGEVGKSGRMAKAIVSFRKNKRLTTIADILSALRDYIPAKYQAKLLSQIFQALRIEVNRELEALESMLSQTLSILQPGGKIVIMSYHSLEDRLVKHFFQTGNTEGVLHKDFYGNPQVPFKILTKKPISATEQEMTDNTRARSAKLRVAEKI